MTPYYTVRESARARRVRLVMSERDGLVVVVPKRFDWQGIPAILEDKRAWIEKTEAELERRKWSLDVLEPALLPETVSLRAISEEWLVEYCPGTGETHGVRCRESRASGSRVVRLSGDVSDETACRRALSRWVTRKGRDHLVPSLHDLAEQTGFRVGRVSIRQQRTRWGSCSRKDSISLNAKLLFLPAELTGYVLLHELCHTREPNHSARFWALVESMDPDYRRKRKALREVAAYVPGWLSLD